jgi:DNA-binding NtrC family response regulator
MPPLRDRDEDVIELAHHALRQFAVACGKPVESIDDDALVALQAYPWPGNIRELQNVIERAVVVCDGATIRLADLPPEVSSPRHRPTPATTGSAVRVPTPSQADGARRARVARHERERAEILDALQRTGWNRTEAARELGLARSTLLSRMKKFGLLSER